MGPEGLSAALQSRPDLIVLDLMLPGCSGFEVRPKLRDSLKLESAPEAGTRATVELPARCLTQSV